MTDKYSIINLLFTMLAMSIAKEKIMRLTCRREALFKIGQRDHVLTGTSSHILQKATKRSLKTCAKRCTDYAGCMSFMFMSNSALLNCQLLNKEIAGLTSTDIEQSAGWNIYEPVEQITSRCHENTCMAGTLCRESCEALTGYTCEDINECESNPCKNGGTCSNLANAYSCSCSVGWTGVNCETDINECSSNPCYNGGTCLNQLAKYACSCTSQWGGNRCQTDLVDDCVSSPCANGGACQDLTSAFRCNCLSGYYGTTCRKDIKGTIKSLNYPSQYPNSKIQSWILDATSGRVQITFNDFNTESCCDKVILRDGRYSTSPIIATLSGSLSSGSSYVSTGNTMYVRFKTDGSAVRRGWKATWTRHY